MQCHSTKGEPGNNITKVTRGFQLDSIFVLLCDLQMGHINCFLLAILLTNSLLEFHYAIQVCTLSTVVQQDTETPISFRS